MLAFKEQKDTTLYLRNVSGLLQTKWMQMVKQREDLNEHVDNMIADFSHAIDKFDEDGKKRHEELHNEVRRRRVGMDPSEWRMMELLGQLEGFLFTSM